MDIFMCTAFAYTVFILQSTSDHFDIACYRRAREDIWKDSLQDMQTSSGHITGMFLSRSRSCAGEKQTLPPECPTLSSPPVIHSPFTCPENTRWANPSYSLLFAPDVDSFLLLLPRVA